MCNGNDYIAKVKVSVMITFPKVCNGNEDQRTNGPLNAHLISGPSISTKHTKPG